MSDWKIEQKGFDELAAKLTKMQDMSVFDDALRESLKVLQQEASRFPPQPSRTRSKHFNTWVREVGRLPRSAFGVSAKTGKATIRRAGRAVLQPSEKMLKQWKEAQPQIVRAAGTITGRIVNKASYGQFVQGEKQAKFHAQTGWKTTQEIERAQVKRIVGIFQKVIEKAFQ